MAMGLKRIWDWMVPPGGDSARRFRIALTAVSGLAMMAAAAGMILFWKLTGDLEAETPLAGAVFLVLIAGLIALARVRSRLALWLLVALLGALLALDLTYYGVASATVAALVIPIMLAATGLGLREGLAAAALAALAVWGIAAGQYGGWWAGGAPATESLLTFDAPALTMIFLIAALIGGAWEWRGGNA